MLIDKHEADNVLKRIPGLTIKMNPELAAIDRVLDDDELFCMIRDDLAQRYPKTLTAGRKSTPVEVVLRMLAIKHLYDLSYEQTVLQVADSLVLRQFCRVYLQAVPDQSTLCRWANLIRPQTLQAFNQRIMNLAIDHKLTQGRKLRMDGMVVETTIHHPTDSRLLADSVRVLGRTLSRAKRLLGSRTELSKEMFRNRQRSAKRTAHKIAELSRRGREQLKPHYQRLVQTTRATIRQAGRVLTQLQDLAADEGHRLIETLQTFLPRAEQVLDQTERRVFFGEKVPQAEKLVSIEHGNLLHDETFEMMAEKGAWFSMQPILNDEDAIPFPEGSFQQEKFIQVTDGTSRGIELAKKHGVKVAFGTDCLFDPELARKQGKLLAKLQRWYTPFEVLKMATYDNAQLVKLCGPRDPYPGKLGVVEEGALADLILVDGNPLENIDLVVDPDSNFKVIMKDGQVYKNTVN
jgi:cytosine/adenosine deaminase-related metal-dependent hydrolase